MNIYYIITGIVLIVLSIVLIVRKDWREKLKDWFPGLLLIAGGLLAFAGLNKKQTARRKETPTNPIAPPKGAHENDKEEEIRAEIYVADDVSSDTDAEYLRKRAEQKRK